MCDVEPQKSWRLSLYEVKSGFFAFVRLAQKKLQRIKVRGDPSGAINSERDLELLMEIKKKKRQG